MANVEKSEHIITSTTTGYKTIYYDLPMGSEPEGDHRAKIYLFASGLSGSTVVLDLPSFTTDFRYGSGWPDREGEPYFDFDNDACEIIKVNGKAPYKTFTNGIQIEGKKGIRPNFMNGLYEDLGGYGKVGAVLRCTAYKSGNNTGTMILYLGVKEGSSVDEVFEVPNFSNGYARNTVTLRHFNDNTISSIELALAGEHRFKTKAVSTNRYYLSSSKVSNAYAGTKIKSTDFAIALRCANSQKLYHLSDFRPGGEDASLEKDTSNDILDRSINVSDLTDIYFPSTGDAYAYKVKTDFKDGDDDVILIGPSTPLVKFSSTPLSNYKPSVSQYEQGATILASALAADMKSTSNPNALVKYTDGKTIHISELNITTQPTASIDLLLDGHQQKGLQTLIIQPGHRYEDVKVNLSIGIAGQTLTTSYSVSVSDVYPAKFVISNQQLDFNIGDDFEYGDNATAVIYNALGEVIDFPCGDKVSDLIASGVLVADNSKIGQPIEASDIAEDGTCSLSIALASGQSVSYRIYVSYCDNFRLSNSILAKTYVDSGVSTDISSLFSLITAKYDYHENKADSTRSTTTVETDGYSFSPTSIEADKDSVFTYSISLTPKECPKQTLTASINGQVIVNAYVSLDVSGVNLGTYYMGRDGQFQLPTNLTSIRKNWNNPAKEADELSGTELTKLKYRLPGPGEYLEVGDPVSASATQIDISLPLSDEAELAARANIKRIADPITSFEIKDTADFTLGNKAGALFAEGAFRLNAKFASGAVEEVTDLSSITFHSYDEDTEEYGDEALIMTASELATLYVKYDGDYFSIATTGKLLPKIPTGSLEIPGSVRKSFLNDEPVDYRSLEIKVSYSGADPSTTQTLTLDEGNVATASTFALSNDKLTAFDGTQSFSLTFDGPSTKQTITAKCLNRFDGSTAVTSSFEVTVIQINAEDIVQIGVKNPTTVYYLGQTFLNSSDETEVTIKLSDGNSATVRLKDVPSLLSTEPIAGTVFNKLIDSEQVTISVIDKTSVFATYNISVLSAPSTSTTIVHDIVAVLLGAHHPKVSGYGLDPAHVYRDASGNIVCKGYYFLVDAGSTIIDENGERVLHSGSSPTFYGYLEDCFNTSLSARVILFKDYLPPVDGQSNISVDFTCYVEGNADRINKCRIAKLFGNQNAKNRLFVSGNPDHPNCDWHSGEPGSQAENGDFSYFGDMSYCYYGQTDNEIMGYDIVATDKMVALKSRSKVEPTNYFRTSSLIQAIDASGNSVNSIDGGTLYMEAFPLATGNTGEGALVMNGVVNLNGDTLFIASDNTIRGLDISGQVGDSQRIAYSRSAYIDPELKGLDLTRALLWTNNDKLFLCLEDRAYVTDYRTYSSDNGQYEWFAIDVGGITALIDLDGVIYYGDAEGNLRRFEEGRYNDCEKIFVEAGGAIASEVDDRFGAGLIAYDNSINQLLDEQGDYTFSAIASTLQDRLFYRVGEISSERGANVDFLIDYDKNVLKLVALGKDGKIDGERYSAILDELARGGKFYLNKPNGKTSIEGTGNFAEYYRAYTLKELDTLDREYKLIDADGNECQLSSPVQDGEQMIVVKNLVRADLCKPLVGEYQVAELNKEDCTFRLTIGGRPIRIVEYGDQNALVADFPSELHRHTPVKSYFVSAPAMLGSISHRKTIWAWTLTGYKERNDLEVCKATNERNLENMQSLFLADDKPVGFSFEALSFEAIDFEKSVVPRKHTYIRPISVPFLCFGFRSGKDAPSVLTAVSIVYSTPLLGKGKY